MRNALIIATDSRYLAAMVAVAGSCSQSVTVFAVGDASLAESAASSGAGKVVHFDTKGDLAPMAYADAIAREAEGLSPDLIMGNDAPATRALLVAAARARNASVFSDVVDIASEPEGFCATCGVAGGIAVRCVHVQGSLAAVYGGKEDGDGSPSQAEVTLFEGSACDLRVVERIAPKDAFDLKSATRIVGVGRGVRSSDDLAMAEELASLLGGVVACTLPVSEDNHWYDGSRVLGSSHNSAAPDLYLALGISGSPNHLSGVKDAKAIVAVNSNPDAEIFKRCDYGIVADLYDFVPALQRALA